jgi:hypothetical protein
MAGFDLVDLHGFNFMNSSVPGTELVVESMPGWFDTPEPRSEAQPLVATDGDVPAEITYGPRMVTIAGSAHAENLGALLRLRDRLAGLVSGGPVTLTVEAGGIRQWATVERSGALQFEVVTNEYAIFSRTFKAPDPRKYGVTRRFPETGTSPAGTSVGVFHEGNYGAAPKITVTGYSPGGFTAFGTGSDRFVVTEGVNTNETLVADFKAGHVFLNGVRKPAAGGYRSLARIPAGIVRSTNAIPAQPDVASNVRFFVEVTDTWI